MKNNRNGQSAILTAEQFEELLASSTPKYKLLWAVCYFTSCRISEALQLKRSDIKGGRIIFPAEITKNKKTRELGITTKLAAIINETGLPDSGYLFPGVNGNRLTRQRADAKLRALCDYLGFQGVSTHSFRRTSITNLHNRGIPLKQIQCRSGHASLTNLALYIEVDQQAVDDAGELL